MSKPGLSNMNSTTPTKTGPQSDIFLMPMLCGYSLLAITLSNGKIISLLNLECLEVEMKGERGHYKGEMYFGFALGRRDKD